MSVGYPEGPHFRREEEPCRPCGGKLDWLQQRFIETGFSASLYKRKEPPLSVEPEYMYTQQSCLSRLSLPRVGVTSTTLCIGCDYVDVGRRQRCQLVACEVSLTSYFHVARKFRPNGSSTSSFGQCSRELLR